MCNTVVLYVTRLFHCLGGVAWIFDDTTDKDGLVLNNSAHVVMDVDMQVKSRAVGDDSSVLHIISPRTSVLGHHLGVKTIVYPMATLALADHSSVIVDSATRVLGRFNSNTTENLVLNSWFHLEQEDITLLSLTLNELGNLTTVPDSLLVVDANTVVVNGTFNVSRLKFNRLNDLTVKELGTLEYDPVSDLDCNELVINGTMTIRSNLTIKGRILHNMNVLKMGEQGILTLDSMAQVNMSWTGHSVIASHSLELDGIIHAGQLAQYDAGVGWDHLLIDTNGQLNFDASGQFLIDHMDIKGQLNSFHGLNVTAMTTGFGLHVAVFPTGTILLDSLGTHPLGPWTSQSHIVAETLTIHEGGSMKGGQLQVYIPNITVSGFITFDPHTFTVPINYFKINTTGYVDIVKDTTLLNMESIQGYLNIENGGTLDIDFTCTPPSHDLACSASNITLHTMIMNGTFQAGSLTISSDSISMDTGGVIDVSDGGFTSGKGPGALLTRRWYYFLMLIYCDSTFYFMFNIAVELPVSIQR